MNTTQSKDKATARPWKVQKTQSCKFAVCHTIEEGPMVLKTIAVLDSNETADLIVKAVNNHEALLEACREALKVLESGPDYDAGVYQLLTRAIANAEGR